MRSVVIRIVLCLPSPKTTGLLITHFIGSHELVNTISDICTKQVLENHPLKENSRRCVWIIAFALVLTIANQLDFALAILNPDKIGSDKTNFPNTERLIIGRRDSILLVDPNLACGEQDDEEGRWIRARSRLECLKAQDKIRSQQKMSMTFIKDYENFIQLTISYNTAGLLARAGHDSQAVSHQFAKIGMVVAGIFCIIAPLSLLTGFYGMNVQEFNGATTQCMMS
ncbi:hypothetical protein DL98DRAFT_583874 [Cadophora sp. DSE1049]|nr:hypothetical protein DL98DRAFT_583874 [Cadophora sp. DSE1049]